MYGRRNENLRIQSVEKTKTEKVSAWGLRWNGRLYSDKEATCEETGLKSIHCKRCDERKEITTIPAKGHVKGEVKIENVTESTCEKRWKL